MKRFIVFVSILLVATAGLMLANEAVNKHLLFTSSNVNAYKMYRLIQERPANEVAIIGSSRAEAGFAPKEISPDAFNYGLSGSSMRETLFHLKCLLGRDSEAPIIVNLDPWGLGNGNFLGDYRLVANSPEVQSEPKKIKLPIADRIPGLRFHGKFRSNIAECMNNRLAVTKTMERGAILQRLSRNDEEWAYIIAKCKPSKFGCNAETKALLDEMLCSNASRKIAFVVSPVAPPWWERFEGKAELLELEQYLSGYSNVQVLDFTDSAYGFDLPEFMDLTHLNEQGARRFSRLLKERLRIQ